MLIFQGVQVIPLLLAYCANLVHDLVQPLAATLDALIILAQH